MAWNLKKIIYSKKKLRNIKKEIFENWFWCLSYLWTPSIVCKIKFAFLPKSCEY